MYQLFHKMRDRNKIIREIKEEIEPFWERIASTDKSLEMHSNHVADLSMTICHILGYPDNITKEVATGALLHDIGKIYIPKEILLKPSSLTPEEYSVVKTHPSLGYETLNEFDFSDIVLDICLHHHDFENGTGYPDRSTFLYRETKIVALADKYDAIHSKRSYKKGKNAEKSMQILEMFRKSYTDVDDIYKALYAIVL